MTTELEAPIVNVVESAAGFSIRRDGAIQVRIHQDDGSTRKGTFPEELAFLRRTHGWTLDHAEQLVDVANQLAEATIELAIDALDEAQLDQSAEEATARHKAEPAEHLPEFLL